MVVNSGSSLFIVGDKHLILEVKQDSNCLQAVKICMVSRWGKYGVLLQFESKWGCMIHEQKYSIGRMACNQKMKVEACHLGKVNSGD